MGDALRYHVNISAPNLINVCIDDNEMGDMSGRMYCCYCEEAVRFSNIIELLRCMERLFDAISFPQASTKTRMFLDNSEMDISLNAKPKKIVEQEDVIKYTGKIGTFITNVQFRQNATWQGEAFWAETGKVLKFSNTLEYIRRLDGAIGSKEE